MGLTFVHGSLRPGPGVAGAARLTVRVRNDPSIRLVLGSSAELFLVGDHGNLTLASAHQNAPETEYEIHREKESEFTYRFLLDRSTINRIEALRNGHAPRFGARISIYGLNLEPRDPPGFRNTLRGHELVSAEDWVTLFLPSFRYDSADTWEGRLEDAARTSELAKEHEHLDAAVRDFNRGTDEAYSDAFKDVRNAIYRLRSREAELGLADIMGKENWTRASNFLSISLHPETQIPATVGRADAEFAITCGRALLRRVANALATRSAPSDERNPPA